MSYDAGDHDAVYIMAQGTFHEAKPLETPDHRGDERMGEGAKTPANADPDEDRWAEEGILYLGRKALEHGKPARNGKTQSVFCLRHADAEAHL